MTEIPHAVLSEKLEELIDGRRLVAAVFITYKFDPEFFEQQVLPVFLNVPLSHADAIRRVQLEDALRDVRHRIAVYYDQNGLDTDAKAAKLDISRVPVKHRTGIFHAKNVFALVEEDDSEDEGEHLLSLIVAGMSANLTRAGWWENVEVCHAERIESGESIGFRDDLIGYLKGIQRRTTAKTADGHESLEAVLEFLWSTEQSARRAPGGRLETRFFDGSGSLVEFLNKSVGKSLRGLNLEVISPYFDDSPESGALKDLLAEFKPEEVRVYLPKKDTGEAQCSAKLFQWVRSRPGVSWGRLPKGIIRGGKSEDAYSRRVHAKVYRFFSPGVKKKEFLFVGSVNLTTAAHQSGGNFESGFLVELEPSRRPDWWLEADSTRPQIFEPASEDEGAAGTAGSRLSLRYFWSSKKAEAYWEDAKASQKLRVSRTGISLFALESLPAREWIQLDAARAAALAEALISTSIFLVEGDRPEPAAVLVQEEGMACRPSLWSELSSEEVLQYWSLLTVEQRAAFLEEHADDAVWKEGGAELLAEHRRVADSDSFFGRFAGCFMSFDSMERSVRHSLESENWRAAEYRLFGQKYDSLGYFLQRVRKDADENPEKLVEQYVMTLCTRQTVKELRKAFPGFFQERPEESRRLEKELEIGGELRARLSAGQEPAMEAFLDWFDGWFLKRAAPVESGTTS